MRDIRTTLDFLNKRWRRLQGDLDRIARNADGRPTLPEVRRGRRLEAVQNFREDGLSVLAGLRDHLTERELKRQDNLAHGRRCLKAGLHPHSGWNVSTKVDEATFQARTTNRIALLNLRPTEQLMKLAQQYAEDARSGAAGTFDYTNWSVDRSVLQAVLEARLAARQDPYERYQRKPGDEAPPLPHPEAIHAQSGLGALATVEPALLEAAYPAFSGVNAGLVDKTQEVVEQLMKSRGQNLETELAVAGQWFDSIQRILEQSEGLTEGDAPAPRTEETIITTDFFG